MNIPKMLVSKDKLAIGCASLLIYAILSHSFTVLPANFEEFERFRNGDPELYVILLSYALPLLLTALLLILPVSDLIYCILCLLLILTIYPATILWRQLNADPAIIFLHVLHFLSLVIISKVFNKPLTVTALRKSQMTPLLLVLSIALIAPFVITFGPHIDLKNLILYNIYSSRALEAQLSNRFMDYAYSSLTNVVLPMLLIIAILHKEYIRAILAFAMLIFMFLVGGHKSVFFASFLLIYFYFGSYQRKILYLFTGIAASLAPVLIIYHITSDLFPFALITRRIFFIPGILDIGYFDFFDGKPLFWSDSILRSWIAYPYHLAPRNLIGEHVLLNPLTNANSGVVADGFMNLGIPGAILNILLVSTIFAILNNLNLSHRFFGLVFVLFFTFLSTYFFTTMITHGGLLLVVLASLLLRSSRTTYND
jgi:hypothetical protein